MRNLHSRNTGALPLMVDSPVLPFFRSLALTFHPLPQTCLLPLPISVVKSKGEVFWGIPGVYLGYFLRRCFCRDFGLRLRFSTGMIVHRHFCWRKQVDGSTSFSCSFSKCLSGKGFLWIASSQGHSNKNSAGQACSWIRTVHFGRILGGLLDGSSIPVTSSHPRKRVTDS